MTKRIHPGAHGRLLIAALLAGCAAGNNNNALLDSGLAPLDTGVSDRGTDGSTDTASADVPTADSGRDAGAGSDAATDARVDTGVDVPAVTDAGTDAPAVTDAGVDAVSVSDTGVDVPRPIDTGVDVPAVTDTGVDVPVVTDTGTPGCDAVHVCGAGLSCCGGRCTNLAADPANCGACGTVCGTGLCGASLAAPMDVMPANWVFNGTAAWDGTAHTGVLTTVATGQTGTIWYRNPVAGDAFDVAFEFRISGGTRADGMAFAIQRTGSAAVGAGGGGFGVVGLNGYAVELDDYNNLTCGDVDGNHTAVDSLVACDTSVNTPTPLGVSPDLYPTVGDIADGAWRQALVHVTAVGAATQATVTINRLPSGSGTSTAVSNVVLAGYTPGQTYWFGFGGATGGLTNRHEVRNVTVTFPTPRCL